MTWFNSLRMDSAPSSIIHPIFRFFFSPLLSRFPGLSLSHLFELPLKDDKNYIPRVLFRYLPKRLLCSVHESPICCYNMSK